MKWKSLEEKKPTPGREVLLWGKIAGLKSGSRFTQNETILWEVSGKFPFGSDCFTHWMPLPKTPLE